MTNDKRKAMKVFLCFVGRRVGVDPVRMVTEERLELRDFGINKTKKREKKTPSQRLSLTQTSSRRARRAQAEGTRAGVEEARPYRTL